MDLLVILGIHEAVVSTVFIEIFHLSLIEHCALHPILRPEPMIDDRSGAELAEFGLDHPSPVSRCNVLVIHHLVEFAVHQDRVSPAQLCCLNHYRQAHVVD